MPLNHILILLLVNMRIFSIFCRGWKVAPKVCVPNGILTILLKEYWPGLFAPDPVRHPKRLVLAMTWDHYEAAPHADYVTHAKAVKTNFWVSSLLKHES